MRLILNIVNRLYGFALIIKFFPYIIAVLFMANKQLVKEDVKRWSKIHGIKSFYFVKLLEKFPEFRNLFYARFVHSSFVAKLFSFIYKKEETLHIYAKHLGGGNLDMAWIRNNS